MTIALFVSAFLAVISVVPGTAVAATGSTGYSPQVIVTIAIPSANNAFTSTLSVTFNPDSQMISQMRLKADLIAAIEGAPNSLPPPGDGGYLDVSCGDYHNFSDSDGTFKYRHLCGATTATWGYSLSSGLQAIIVSEVTEYGIIWDRNGVSMPMGAPHTQAKDYQFHGTFNPLNDGDYLVYTDEYYFTVDVDGQTGSASLLIDGAIHQLG